VGVFFMPERSSRVSNYNAPQLKDFDVQIRETYEKLVTVQAENMAHAKRIAEYCLKNGDYVNELAIKDVAIIPLYPYNRDYDR
jgi:hypothetical protein